MTQAPDAVKWGDRAARDLVIRQAATGLLARDGFSGLTMRAVAAGAGISLGAVYRYYPSKEELYASLYAERLEQLTDEITVACAPAQTVVDAFVAAIGCYLEVYQVFGRELNIAGIIAGQTELSAAATGRLIAASMAALGTIPTQIARIEPDLHASMAGRQTMNVQLVWVFLNGIAEHFGGVRQHLFGADRTEFVRYSAEVLVAGLRAYVGV